MITKKPLSSKDETDYVREEKEKEAVEVEDEVKEASLLRAAAFNDVPDGAQISKAFDTLCNIVRNRIRRYRQPEPSIDFYTKGRYVLVSGESSYLDPCFYSTTPSPGHIIVTICNNGISPLEPDRRQTPPPPPSPSPAAPIVPVIPPSPPDDDHNKDNGDKSKGKEDGDDSTRSPTPQSGEKKDKGGKSGQEPPPVTSSSSTSGDSMSYEKVELVESVKKLSPEGKLKRFEETSMVVETLIEKTSKKKHGDRAT